MKYIKRLVLMFLVVLYSVSLFQNEAFAQEVKGVIDGEQQYYDQSLIIKNGRTFVPLRGIFESLGANVNWNQQEKKVTATKDGKQIELVINSKRTKIDGSIHLY